MRFRDLRRRKFLAFRGAVRNIGQIDEAGLFAVAQPLPAQSTERPERPISLLCSRSPPSCQDSPAQVPVGPQPPAMLGFHEVEGIESVGPPSMHPGISEQPAARCRASASRWARAHRRSRCWSPRPLPNRAPRRCAPHGKHATPAARGLNRPTAQDLSDTYEMAITVLFRLLFVAYAEDKDLLPYRWNGLYRRRAVCCPGTAATDHRGRDSPDHLACAGARGGRRRELISVGGFAVFHYFIFS